MTILTKLQNIKDQLIVIRIQPELSSIDILVTVKQKLERIRRYDKDALTNCPKSGNILVNLEIECDLLIIREKLHKPDVNLSFNEQANNLEELKKNLTNLMDLHGKKCLANPALNLLLNEVIASYNCLDVEQQVDSIKKELALYNISKQWLDELDIHYFESDLCQRIQLMAISYENTKLMPVDNDWQINILNEAKKLIDNDFTQEKSKRLNNSQILNQYGFYAVANDATNQAEEKNLNLYTENCGV